MKVLLIGSPGVGKGTYAVELAKKLNVPHISCGQIIREIMKENSELSEKVSPYYLKGILVPDEITLELVANRVNKPDCKNGFVLDGYPRTEAQATQFNAKIKLDIVINLIADEEVIIKRLSGRQVCSSCGSLHNKYFLKPKIDGRCDKCKSELKERPDDTAEKVRVRLNLYKKDAQPLLNYYEKQGILKRMNCNVEFHSNQETQMKKILDLINKQEDE